MPSLFCRICHPALAYGDLTDNRRKSKAQYKGCGCENVRIQKLNREKYFYELTRGTAICVKQLYRLNFLFSKIYNLFQDFIDIGFGVKTDYFLDFFNARNPALHVFKVFSKGFIVGDKLGLGF